MTSKTYILISEFLYQRDTPFTIRDFQNYLKDKGGQRIPVSEIYQLLFNSEMVFPLEDDLFITKAGVFLGRWFSFKPSKEEAQKGQVLIGHRSIPFTNPECSPDNLLVCVRGQNLKSESCVFSMNLAMDVYALFGEGYVIPTLFNDRSNANVTLKKVQYNMPKEITLTSWPLDKIAGEQKFEYGDRILCRVIDWENNVIEMQVKKNVAKSMTLSDEAIQREEWYSRFENALLESFDKHGPLSSIDEQLAVLYLENQEELCIKNCGSAEECLLHTTKLGFQPFGVESRIWRKGEIVPYAGKWISEEDIKEVILKDITSGFSPNIMDSYLKNNLYLKSKGQETCEIEELIDKAFPFATRTDIFHNKTIVENIKKRAAEMEKEYNRFEDYHIAAVRKRTLELYTEIIELFTNLAISDIDAREFPQQDLAILSQLYGHSCRMLEEMNNPFLNEKFPIDDVSISLDGMEETFNEIGSVLYESLERLRYKNFSVLNGDENNDG